MAKVNFNENTNSPPVWMGDFGSRESILPMPAKLETTEFAAGADGKKRVPSGTLVGRTLAERDAGTGFGVADVANDDEMFLTARDVGDLEIDNDIEFYRHQRLVKENFLPDWDALDVAEKTKVRELYACIEGVA